MSQGDGSCRLTGAFIIAPLPHRLLRSAECPESLRLSWVLPAIRMSLKNTSEDVTPPSSLLRTHAPDQISPSPSGFPLDRWVFAGFRQSLLRDGASQHYLCNPCVGAWTNTPPRSLNAFTHFFSKNFGLTSREIRSARELVPAMQLPQGAYHEAAVIRLSSGSHAH